MKERNIAIVVGFFCFVSVGFCFFVTSLCVEWAARLAETLRTYFGHYGRIKECNLIADESVAPPRRYAFIVFSDPSTALAVCRYAHGE